MKSKKVISFVLGLGLTLSALSSAQADYGSNPGTGGVLNPAIGKVISASKSAATGAVSVKGSTTTGKIALLGAAKTAVEGSIVALTQPSTSVAAKAIKLAGVAKKSVVSSFGVSFTPGASKKLYVTFTSKKKFTRIVVLTKAGKVLKLKVKTKKLVGTFVVDQPVLVLFIS